MICNDFLSKENLQGVTTNLFNDSGSNSPATKLMCFESRHV